MKRNQKYLKKASDNMAIVFIVSVICGVIVAIPSGLFLSKLWKKLHWMDQEITDKRVKKLNRETAEMLEQLTSITVVSD